MHPCGVWPLQDSQRNKREFHCYSQPLVSVSVSLRFLKDVVTG